MLYTYLYANKKMVLLEDLNKFHTTIEKNLEEMKSDSLNFYSTLRYDDEVSIYYSSKGKNDDVYYILKPDFDLKKAKSIYMGCLSTDVLIASQKDNALKCIDLIRKNGKIVPYEKNLQISDSYNFMDQFLEKLKNDEYKIKSCSKTRVDTKLTNEYIIEQLEAYQRLLDSELIDKMTKNEKIKKLNK